MNIRYRREANDNNPTDTNVLIRAIKPLGSDIITPVASTVATFKTKIPKFARLQEVLNGALINAFIMSGLFPSRYQPSYSIERLVLQLNVSGKLCTLLCNGVRYCSPSANIHIFFE